MIESLRYFYNYAILQKPCIIATAGGKIVRFCHECRHCIGVHPGRNPSYHVCEVTDDDLGQPLFLIDIYTIPVECTKRIVIPNG